MKYFGPIRSAARVRARRTGYVAILLPSARDSAMMAASATG